MRDKWVIKRKHPESILGIYQDRDKAQAEAEWRNADYQTDNYVVEPFDPERWGQGLTTNSSQANELIIGEAEALLHKLRGKK